MNSQGNVSAHRQPTGTIQQMPSPNKGGPA
jgi:hypothetical protein